MKKIILIALLFTTILFGEDESFLKMEMQLDSTYQQIIEKYQKDTLFIQKLEKSQNAWLAYRDAQLNARFPKENKREEYGSVYPMCAENILIDLTKERIEELQIWLDGFEEGEVCSGSVEIR